MTQRRPGDDGILPGRYLAAGPPGEDGGTRDGGGHGPPEGEVYQPEEGYPYHDSLPDEAATSAPAGAAGETGDPVPRRRRADPVPRRRRADPVPRRRRADPVPRRRRADPDRPRPLLAGVLAVLALVVVLAAAGLVWALHQVNPGGHLGRRVAVTIPKGASPAQIGRILARDGVIHNATLFHLYTRIEGTAIMQSGTYELATNQSYGRVIGLLESGIAPLEDRLAVPEGFTLQDIAARVAALPGMHITAKSFLAAARNGSVRSPYEPKGVQDLEGLVFPATYIVTRQETPVDILTQMVQAFDQRAQSIGLARAAAARHETSYQLVTVASIVQGEAKLTSQFPDVASAIYNRLADGMTLGVDSTLVYALRQKDPNLDIAKVDYETPSPYNTRLHHGLPPTPIDSPGLPALAAAAHAPRTSLVYFVEVNPDGRLGFASTSAGFDQLLTQCRSAKLGC